MQEIKVKRKKHSDIEYPECPYKPCVRNNNSETCLYLDKIYTNSIDPEAIVYCKKPLNSVLFICEE
jgi:hypothetical protein